MELSPYGFCLLLGSTGLFTMAFVGQWSRHGQSDAVSHGIDHQIGAPGAVTSHTHHGDVVVHAAAAKGVGASRLWALLSPRTVFTLLVGAGAAGSIVQTLWPEPWPLAAAVVGALGFELALVGPLSRWLLRFASSPARTLESALLDRAVAVSSFDAAGHGMVSVELDGHVVHLLGTLTEEERARGVRIRTGDELIVEAVDAERNRCTVARA